METAVASNGFPVAVALETSLVEWKLSPCGHDNCAAQTLGNFLSGMETRIGRFLLDRHEDPWKLP